MGFLELKSNRLFRRFEIARYIYSVNKYHVSPAILFLQQRWPGSRFGSDFPWTEVALAPRAVITTPGNDAVLPGGRNWMNTRPQGWFQLDTDGKRMWVERGK